MNIRCSFCQTPYAIGRTETIAALQHMEAENLTHYDAHCPRCRRATPVLREKLEMTLPNWREALHELEHQAEASPASTPQPGPASTPKAESTSEPFGSAQDKPAHAKHHRSRVGAKAKEAVKPAAKSSLKGKKETAAKKKGK